MENIFLYRALKTLRETLKTINQLEDKTGETFIELDRIFKK